MMDLGLLGIIISGLLIGIGIYGLSSTSNIIRVLLSSEIILNASILFVFSYSSVVGMVYKPVIFSLFAIGMALTEVVVAFAAVLLYYRQKDKLEVE
ncbi:NADH-ubiquinone oxidoreductase chain 4L [Sulfolobus islandicus Y.G.57.14]|jgi:NADH-quinone oxidoreductase subunit K|uniref:NADH-ubiquinone oxidoreductase chain K n=11 Tax=Saccharolobus TaxID=2100760 RepID=A0A8F5BRN8_SACSH|nr:MULTISPECIES: NADH-quinone oxidoreductase subunit K [Sulfolobaceae]ACP35908.1 NADH-ubiquinone oxidoreductase chain 4L [Sulfolobus islandicus L.S.2.15]ACP38518.1 NADH-ubiquinone oxidoreductase chain 4L [Sulfolobus islandicus M.14.25]ACP46146.1 NADH-ubiquinone oxidoreductase chain 4L [Sulfolobus islandicus Y.G.57.14]ACP48142.1 NADH-ubiquinone oxidoreductase chain 4L [Sulfolobus islandicus Y.N.15.51]ACP55762.1 NADH-ubiquinone oxidoreductase chain 4L [Sulfolobus islandicus M.16.27]